MNQNVQVDGLLHPYGDFYRQCSTKQQNCGWDKGASDIHFQTASFSANKILEKSFQ